MSAPRRQECCEATAPRGAVGDPRRATGRIGLAERVLAATVGANGHAVLRELFLLTRDPQARRDILEQLARLERDAGAGLAAEMFEMRKQLENSWHSERPAVPQTMDFLTGRPSRPGFDLGELARGGVATISLDTFEQLEPPTDEPAAPPSGSP